MRILTLAIAVSALVVNAVRADVWGEAEKQIVRLDPIAFNELPREIVNELKAMKCAVPQTYERSKPHNVINGSFAERTQMDWAVLCSRKGVSLIKVFWGGAARCHQKFQEDRTKSGFKISVTTRLVIREPSVPPARKLSLSTTNNMKAHHLYQYRIKELRTTLLAKRLSFTTAVTENGSH